MKLAKWLKSLLNPPSKEVTSPSVVWMLWDTWTCGLKYYRSLLSAKSELRSMILERYPDQYADYLPVITDFEGSGSLGLNVGTHSSEYVGCEYLIERMELEDE